MAEARILGLEQLVGTSQQTVELSQTHTQNVAIELERYKEEVTAYRTVTDRLLTDLNRRHGSLHTEVVAAVSGLRDALALVSKGRES